MRRSTHGSARLGSARLCSAVRQSADVTNNPPGEFFKRCSSSSRKARWRPPLAYGGV